MDGPDSRVPRLQDETPQCRFSGNPSLPTAPICRARPLGAPPVFDLRCCVKPVLYVHLIARR